MTDTQGLLLAVRVHSAAIQDREAARDVLALAKKKYPTLTRVFVDSGYVGPQSAQWQRELELEAHVSTCSQSRFAWHHRSWPPVASAPAFELQRVRWVIERSHAWTSRPRRMAKDFDVRLDVAEAWIWFVHMLLLARRIAIM